MRRRKFVQSIVGASLGTALTSCTVDDMGYSDLGCYGGEIHTPNLDSLAKNGVQFTQFYNAARCCPTRASLLTGLYPHQAGVGGMDNSEGVPSYQGFLNRRCVTIAEVLKTAGYRTYMSGKWHVGTQKGHWPRDRGFDRYFGLINGASNFFNKISYRDPDQEQTMLLDDQPFSVPPTSEAMWENNTGFYMTDAFTDYGLQFLDEHTQHTDSPFFLYLAYTAPHWPLHAFPEDIQKYKGHYAQGWDVLRKARYERQKEMGLFDESVALADLDEEVTRWEEASQAVKDEFEQEMEIYAAMIDRMDRNIGRVIRKLEQMQELDNTLILFVSDNGGCHTTPVFPHLQGTPGGPNSFPCYGFMGAELSNVPFRKYKQYIHEGGISTPMIVHYPKGIQGGQKQHQVGHVIDIMPTIVELCGADYPERRDGTAITPMQGISLTPAFRESHLQRAKPLYWEHVRNKGVRIGDWKLVAAKPDLQWELYDIKKDRAEIHDLSQQYPQKKEEMIAVWESWARSNLVKPFHKSP